MVRLPPRSTRTDTLFPLPAPFLSDRAAAGDRRLLLARRLPVGSRIYGPGLLVLPAVDGHLAVHPPPPSRWGKATVRRAALSPAAGDLLPDQRLSALCKPRLCRSGRKDRKSTRLNSSH